MTDILDPLIQSVFPLIYVDEKENITVAGTSILVEYKEQPYLLTAAHVLRNPGNQYRLFILLRDVVIPLNGPALMSKLPSEESKPDLDIAYFPLAYQLDLLSQLNGYKTLTLREFDEDVKFAREHYFIFGYPWRKAKYKRKDHELTARPLQYFTDRITNEKLYEKFSRPQESHILVHYKPKSSKNKDGKRQLAPHPHGISGGPLFRALVNKNDEVIMLIIEGLLIEWKDNQVIVATKKSAIRNFIDANQRG